MEFMNLTLEYFFIYNPTLIPDNPKASEVEMMDAKKIFFYPTLVDINKQRNLMGMGEGFISFFNIFKKPKATPNNTETQVFALDRRVMVSKCIDNDNYIVLIMAHKFGSDKNSKYRVINNLSRINLAVYKRILDRFCKVYRMIFEPVQYYISSQDSLVEFTENILRFVESYFVIEKAYKNEHRSINALSKLFGDIIIKKKLSYMTTLPIVRTAIELKNDYSNFYDLIAFKSSYLIYTGLDDDVVKTIISLLFELDISTTRSMESRSRVTFSKFFESYYDLEFLETFNKSEYTLTEARNKKHFSFNLPVNSNNNTKFYKFYANFIVDNDIVIILLLKNKLTTPALLNRAKNIPKIISTTFANDQLKSKNLYFGFFNILNQNITNAVDIAGISLMNRAMLLFFVSCFFNKQEKEDKNDIYSYYMIVGDEAVMFNLVNSRITWIYSSDIDKYDVIDEFFLLRESVKMIVI